MLLCPLAPLALALWGPPAAGAAATFAPQDTVPVADQPLAVAVGDFNHDGDPDLAVGHSVTPELWVLFGGPGGSFGAPTAYPAARGVHSIALDDFNGDGNLDLAHTNFNSDTVTVRLGLADGTFGARNNFAVGDGPWWVATGDFNGDGDPDLAVVNDIDSPRTISVLLGGPGGRFGPQTQYAPGFRDNVTVADFNGDGDPDLAGPTVNVELAVRLGGPGGSFGAPTSFRVDRGAGGIVSGDFNGDGDPDLATGAFTSGVGVLLGEPGAGFSPVSYYATHEGSSPSQLTVDDFNRDGDPDLAFISQPFAPTASNTVGSLLGRSGGSFGKPAGYPVGNSPLGMATGDFNGDANPDLAVANTGSDTISVLMNTGLTLDPISVRLPATVASRESAPATVELKNNRTTDLSVSGVDVVGPDANDFATNDDTCSGATLPPRGVCAVQVRFRPTHLGLHSARLEFSDDAVGSPQSVSLSGTGTSPVKLSPSQLGFGATIVGTQSSIRSVTLTNIGAKDLSVSGVALAGGDASSFATGDDTCSGATVAPGEACSVAVRFRPGRLGAHSARLEFSDDAPGSPQVAPLSGTGTDPVTFSPSNLAWQPQPDSTTRSRKLTLQNRSGGELTVNAVALAGADVSSFRLPAAYDECAGTTVPAGGTCTVEVRFRPDGVGPKTARLEFTDDAVTSPQSVTLSGTGTPGPWLTRSVQGLKFGAVRVGTTTAPKSVTLTNTGSASMEISSITVEGENPGNFVGLSETCTALASLGPDESCSAEIAFRPSATGERRAHLRIEDTAPRSPHRVQLRGTGT